MLKSATALGRATALVVSLTTGVLYLILALRLRSSGAAPESVIVLASIGLLTIGSGTAAPYLSVYHMYLALFFVFLPPALYMLMGEVFQFVALGAAGYLLACILVHLDVSGEDVKEITAAPSNPQGSLFRGMTASVPRIDASRDRSTTTCSE